MTTFSGRRSVTVMSVHSEVRVQASSRIELVGGQSSLVLDGGNITFTCPGAWKAKGATKSLSQGGSSQAARLPRLPVGAATVPTQTGGLFEVFDEQVVFADARNEIVDGRLRFAVSNAAHAEQRVSGESPEQGLTERLNTQGAQALESALRYARFKFDAQG